VIPWVQLDSAKTPDGAQELRLKQRGAEFSIMLGTNELMNSRLSSSEEELAKLSCDRIAGHSRPKILIGGLGMGFTLRAALAELNADASVTVAELVPAVIAWARGPMAALFAGCLDNPRVNIREADVGHIIRSDVSAWDAVLLDVDNGPEGIVHKGNDALYSAAGLTAARTALKPGGVLAVWSQGPDNGFTRRLKQAGFAVEEVKTRANGKRGARHVIWIATNPR
jgi:spermidine synthase